MSIVFAASLPHSPLLVESIGKESGSKLSQTITAIKEIVEDLESTRPDVLLLISPHMENDKPCLTMNIRPSYVIDFEAFGDFQTKLPVIGAVAFANAIKQPFDTRRLEVPFSITSEERLDYGCTTVLYHILENIPTLPVLPLGVTQINGGSALSYGQRLRPHLVEYPKRVAVIASANLSHKLSPDSPAGFSSRAKAFDTRIRTAIKSADVLRLTRVRSETIQEVGVCGLEPELFLLGMLQGSKYVAKELSYEAPFGIGLPVYRYQ